MSAPVDVLAILKAHADGVREAHDLARGKRRQEIAEAHGDLLAVHAAVAELMAADQEYDAAEAGLSRPSDGPLTKRFARYHKAEKRRAAALARIGGAK